MGIYLGENEMSALKLGEYDVAKVMFGSDLVWEPGGEWSGWSGLTSYWRMNTNSGTTAYDAVGSIDGTLIGAGTTWATGINGSCVDTNVALNHAVDCGDNYSNDGTDPFTLSLWVKRTSSSASGFIGIISKANPVAPSEGWSISWLNGKLRLSIGSNGAVDRLFLATTSSTTLTDTNWNHLVWTYTGSKTTAGMKFYINGTEITSFSSNQTPMTGDSSGTTPLYIGALNATSTWVSIEFIDEVGRWNRVITQSEVTDLYDSGTGIFY